MPYSSLAAIEAAIGAADLIAISDVDQDGAADAAIVAAAIEEADRLIDSYARLRFTPERLAASAVIGALSKRMAIRNLRRDRRMVLQQDVEDEKTDRKWLEDLANGRVYLETDSDGTRAAAVVDKYEERDTSTKNVSRDRLKGFW